MNKKYTFLKEKRIEKGLTLEYIAKRLGLTRQAIFRIENQKQTTTYQNAMLLSTLLGLSINEIVIFFCQTESLLKNVNY